MIKLTALLPRLPGMTRQAFVDYHRDVHAPLLRSDPFARKLVRRYEQAHPTGHDIPGMNLPSHPFDGIAELWFDDIADLETFYTEDHYVEIIHPDERRFIDVSRAQVIISTINPVF